MARAALLALLLVGCATSTPQPLWHREGLTPDQWRVDKAECANRVYTTHYGTGVAGIVSVSMIAPEVMRTCLESKGYHQVEKGPDGSWVPVSGRSQ